MSTRSSATLEAETETLRQLYAALNRNDISAILNLLDPHIERTEPPGFPAAGTIRGPGAVAEHLSKGRNTWAEGTCVPERFLIVRDKILVFIHLRVRLKDRTEWSEKRLVDVFSFRGGRVQQMRTFIEESEAMEWAEKYS